MGRDKQAFQNRIDSIDNDAEVQKIVNFPDAAGLYEANKENWPAQADNLLTLPENFDDKDAVADWIYNNRLILAALNDNKFRSTVTDEGYQAMVKKTEAVRDLIGDWLAVYRQNAGLLLNEDGSMPNANAGNLEARARLNTVCRNFDAFKAAQKEGTEFVKDSDWQAELERTKKLPAAMDADTEEFKAFGELLHGARTFKNSDQYDAIETMVTAFGKGIDVSQLPDKKIRAATEGLAQREKHALKLFLIKDKVEDYLAHKAKDGVKTNVFKKLDAVEQLNQYLGRRLRELDPRDIKFGKKTYSVRDIQVTYQEEYQAAEKKQSVKVQDLSKDPDLEQVVAYGKHFGNPVQNDLKNAGACMDRILLKAQTMKGPAQDLKSLQDAKKLIYAEQLIPHLSNKTAVLIASAQAAVLKASKAMFPDQKTIDLLENGRVQALGNNFLDERQRDLRAFYIAQTFAKDQKYKAGSAFSSKYAPTGASKTEEMIGLAKQFADKEYYKAHQKSLENQLPERRFQGLMGDVRKICESYFLDHLDDLEKLVSPGMKDHQLIEKWTAIEPMMDCFKGVMEDSDHAADPRVLKVKENYGELSVRMNGLSDGMLQKARYSVLHPSEKNNSVYRYQ